MKNSCDSLRGLHACPLKDAFIWYKPPLYGKRISLAKQYNGIVHPKDESDIIIFVSEKSECIESLNIQVIKV